jgi:NAD(P)-dependent dehydrogenase (short-subunit alcohol dehydrogenase family)
MSRKSTARSTVARQRKIQSETDRADERKKSKSSKGSQGKKQKATQAAPRKRPQPPLPKQHLRKPGNEHDLQLRPEYFAPDYAGSGKLEGKVALITGGDSGIGRAVAVLYAREGADVAIVYLNETRDAQETRDAVEKEGTRCLLIEGDVTDPEFCKKAVQRVVDEFGKLSVLVNNAAFQSHASKIEDITEEHFDETLRTNLYGYFHMAKAALPHLREGDCILNTGSETGLFGNKHLLDYSMTKGGIHAFTKSLAANLVDKGIRVNAVAPGPVWTPLNPADSPPEKVAEFGKQSAMKRPAQPEEIAPAYVFLASPACASYISGAILPILGGPTG